ncbi:hypothetical protein O6H91_01G069800 [Diphasiastrum complanatum]|uniref:Uncharacterized protein n=1 Tax=Diphasiastrum complanatum TaxID=34168 RepID=A0ACC2ES01_DIPCM|nr:hypothetical protein O6H91_01G069800 [Diphasiastrum complanatum]
MGWALYLRLHFFSLPDLLWRIPVCRPCYLRIPTPADLHLLSLPRFLLPCLTLPTCGSASWPRSLHVCGFPHCLHAALDSS